MSLTIFKFNIGVSSSYLPSVIEARVSMLGKENDSYLYLQADNVLLDGKKIKGKKKKNKTQINDLMKALEKSLKG